MTTVVLCSYLGTPGVTVTDKAPFDPPLQVTLVRVFRDTAKVESAFPTTKGPAVVLQELLSVTVTMYDPATASVTFWLFPPPFVQAKE